MALEITKQRAGRCITHHYACDCREYCHQQEVAALRREVERLEAERRWIPVSERPPEQHELDEDDYCLVYSMGEIFMSRYTVEHGWSWDFGVIDAWMPLPQPPEAGE